MLQASQFEPKQLTLDAATVADYLKAIGEESNFYRESGLVPPMAIAALAMGALAESLSLPGGSVHVSQDLEFQNVVSVGETVTCLARPGRRIERGQMRLMSLDIEVVNHDQKRVLGGRVAFMLPQAAKA